MKGGIGSYLRNSAWFLLDGILVRVFSLAAIILMARWLGPSEYGAYAYTFSMALLFGMIGHLGLDGLLVRELVTVPAEQQRTMTVGFFLRLAGCVLAAMAMLAYGFLTPIHTRQEKLLFVFASLTILLQPGLSIISGWFRSKNEARIVSLSSITASLAGLLAKVASLASGAGVTAVACIQFLSVLLNFIMMNVFFRKHDGPKVSARHFNRSYAKALLEEGWPLQFATAFSMIYVQIGVPFLRVLVDAEASAYFAVSLNIVLTMQIFGVAISNATFPDLIALRESSPPDFEHLLQLSLSMAVFVSYLFIAFVFLFAQVLVAFLFGDAYEPVVGSLIILSFACPFMIARTILTRWVIVENRGMYLLLSEAAGLLVAISAMYLFSKSAMPSSYGPAIAIVFAYVFSTYLSLLFLRGGRKVFLAMTSALVDPVGPIVRAFSASNRTVKSWR
jgi:O-antigen/teichoic acid export membrane protein